MFTEVKNTSLLGILVTRPCSRYINTEVNSSIVGCVDQDRL